ncbi:helix-turn-helix domain-containing protein [Sphingobacterium sp. UGAL515B_05]|uniref:winged helix-turn-helix transcriptional regulator n=2 Tax=unclassified Sphingobacterium TaxID=2609468 RepID=UPI0029551461|nr:helix-turn-helix domain-containing protein [Sphingobacterium sp. UGAL515B_05]WON93725.1 helix-turn-helix transcriptional regulator [Sphingobacterium sp. UGAL515B_05]
MKIEGRVIEEKVCPLEFAVNAISGKWKIPIVWRINEGEKRPSEMLRGIVKVDRRVLNQQLKELERDGILSKKSFPELPPRVEYSLTPLGEKLVEVLWKLNDWGNLLLTQGSDSQSDSQSAEDMPGSNLQCLS